MLDKKLLDSFGCVQAVEIKVNSLEEFLLSLWSLAQAHKSSATLTWKQIDALICSGLQTPPPAYQDKWEAITLPDTAQLTFAFFETILLYMIVDLHQMRQQGLLEKSDTGLYFGVKSPHGNKWYNPGIVGYLETFTYITGANHEQSQEITWKDLADYIETASYYE